MKEDSLLSHIQNIESDILKHVISLCDQKNIMYFLVEGSLLGAVRHKGMIPWDDDIDIAFPREEYEKFLKVANKELPEELMLRSFHLDPNRKDYLSQVVNIHEFVEMGYKSKKRIENVWIDIFILDGLPSNYFFLKLHKLNLLFHKLLLMWSDIDYFVVDRPRPTYEKLLIEFARKFHLSKYLSTNRSLLKMDSCMKKYSYNESDLVCNFMSEYKFKTIAPKFFFGDGREGDFGALKVKLPIEAEKILENIYGDYMVLPPMESRNKHRLHYVEKSDE